MYNQYPKLLRFTQDRTSMKGVDAEVSPIYVGTGLVEQNKICSTVAFAESYLYYSMIGKSYGNLVADSVSAIFYIKGDVELT